MFHYIFRDITVVGGLSPFTSFFSTVDVIIMLLLKVPFFEIYLTCYTYTYSVSEMILHILF